jgi:hypothetical protein
MRLTVYEEPQLRNPQVIVGLPGIGNVAKISADYLIRQLDAKLFAAFYSPVFPPYVLIEKGRRVELLKNEFYYWKSNCSSSDLIIFTGNAQALTPKAQYVVAEEILDYLKGFKVIKLISMAAYVVDRPVEKPNVYAAATHPELLADLKQYGVIPMGEGSIGGANGLIVGLARARNISGICLLSETLPGSITPAGGILADPKAARALLEVLSKILTIDIDLSDLEAAVKLAYGASHDVDELNQPTGEEFYGISHPPGDYSYI